MAVIYTHKVDNYRYTYDTFDRFNFVYAEEVSVYINQMKNNNLVKFSATSHNLTPKHHEMLDAGLAGVKREVYLDLGVI